VDPNLIEVLADDHVADDFGPRGEEFVLGGVGGMTGLNTSLLT
jgi:hypothetical protein